MKTIKLTQGYEALVDDEDLTWLSYWRWYAHVKRRKTEVAYAVRKENGETVSMAVTIAQKYGFWEAGKEVDHVDGNRLNNQKTNLRSSTGQQNQANQLPRAGTSQYKGVSWDASRQMWRADIRHNYKRLPLGRFSSEEDAARAYDTKAQELFGPHARLNLPPEKNP